MKIKLPESVKIKVYNEYILTITMYGCETWVLYKKILNILQIPQYRRQDQMTTKQIRGDKKPAHLTDI